MLGVAYHWYFLFNFFIFGMIGWIIEQLYCLVMKGQVQQQGFLQGPLKPMYAIAMSVLILLNDTVSLSSLALLLACAIIPTTVEYLSGLLTRYVFHQDYWNYSKLKFNFQGLICVQFSICWTFLTFIGVRYFQPYVMAPIYQQIFPYWFILCPFVLITFVLDEVLTIRQFYLKHATIKETHQLEEELNAGRDPYL